MSARVEIYREERSGLAVPAQYQRADFEPKPVLGKWRWRFVSNGRTMADSGQGYSRRIDCLGGVTAVLGGTYCTNAEVGLPHDAWIARRLGGREQIPVIDLTREAL